MVTDKKIKALDFQTMEQYQEYIIGSVCNGQRQQAKALIKEMSKSQKIDTLKFLEEYGQNEIIQEVKTMIINLI